MPVIDASVYVALMNASEAAHARSWAWFEQAKRAGETVRAPAILIVEVAAAFSRGVGDPALARQVVQQSVRTRAVELVPVTQELAERAADIAAEFGIRGCDAVYVALAQETAEPLISLDRQQLERGRAVVAAREPLGQ